MIAKSDLVILTISSALLVAGVYRWQHGTAVVPSVSVPADDRVVTRPAEPRPENVTVTARPSVEPVEGEGTAGTLTVRRVAPRGSAGASGGTMVADTAPVERPVSVSVDPPVVGAPTAQADEGPLYGVYRVRSGDYLGKIANRFGTSVGTLRSINGIRGSTILVGQEIRYPLPAN